MPSTPFNTCLKQLKVFGSDTGNL